MIEQDLALCYHGLLGLALKETPDVALAVQAADMAYCELLSGGEAVDSSNGLPLKSGAATETAPATALPRGAAFGYVHLQDGSVGWAGENPPGDRGDWAPAQEGPKGGHFWRRVGGQDLPMLAPPGQKSQPRQAAQQRQPSQQRSTYEGVAQGAGAPPIPRSAAQASNLMYASLKQNQSVGTVQKARYQEAMDNVLRAMPEHASKRVSENLKSLETFSSPQELTASFAARHKSDAALQEKVANGWVANGLYTPKKGKMRLDGDGRIRKDAFGEERKNIHEVYAHELTHAIDGPDEAYSRSQEWLMAWDREMVGGRFSAYAAKNPQEGFAEFGRVLYAGVADEETLTQFFPQTTAFFRKYGLMHGSVPTAQAPQGVANPKSPRVLAHEARAPSEKAGLPKVGSKPTLPQLKNTANSLRAHVEEVSRGDTADWCEGVAIALKNTFPGTEIYETTYNGEFHVVAKVGSHFVDVTADQFEGGPKIHVDKKLPKEYGALKSFTPNPKTDTYGAILTERLHAEIGGGPAGKPLVTKEDEKQRKFEEQMKRWATSLGTRRR